MPDALMKRYFTSYRVKSFKHDFHKLLFKIIVFFKNKLSLGGKLLKENEENYENTCVEKNVFGNVADGESGGYKRGGEKRVRRIGKKED